MKIKYKEIYYKFGAIILILAFAATQYFLLLRHKSPYVSDTYFYKNVFYQLQGNSFEAARNKIQSQYDFQNADEIHKNIFGNNEQYEDSYRLFIKRPLYPILIFLTNLFVSSEYLALLIPVFLSYIGVIILAYIFYKKGLGYIFGTLAAGLFIAFYPFLDWSTYFVTDTIGAFFWFLQLFFIYKFFTVKEKKWLTYYAIALTVSLFNREQSVLMFPLFLLMILITKIYKFKPLLIKHISITAFVTLLIILLYTFISYFLGQKNLLDHIVYVQNNHGLGSNTYTVFQSLTWIKNEIFIAHTAFLRDLIRHHWWFTFLLLSFGGITKTLLFTKKKRIIDLIMFSSLVASYSFIFMFPFLSYRFFFPVLISVVYFSVKFIKEYFEYK